MRGNPMRWKCAELGCYNEVARPKIEVFADCFPGRICMGDIDGLVEINGRFLLLEWKSEPKDIPTGQRITYDMLVKVPGRMWTVLCIAGDAKSMDVTHAMVYGKGVHWQPADLHRCKQFMSNWSQWAIGRRRIAA
jgi:hypothetical protein